MDNQEEEDEESVCACMCGGGVQCTTTLRGVFAVTSAWQTSEGGGRGQWVPGRRSHLQASHQLARLEVRVLAVISFRGLLVQGHGEGREGEQIGALLQVPDRSI